VKEGDQDLARCHRCGRELEESLPFCPFCGAPAKEESRKLRYLDEDDEQETTILQMSRDQARALAERQQTDKPIAHIEVRGPAGGLIQKVQLTDRRLSIGRGSDQDIRVTDRTVSRCHAEIWYDEDARFHVRDKDSANGTLLNGEPLVGEAELGDQCRIGVGRHTLIFLEGE
jgi:pSer/pThr/pTyr-binding forkhead associated (FHA) protein